jgi:hypothetical protein
MSDIRRRELLALLGAAAAWPLAARAQQEGPVARVGVIGPSLDRPALKAAYPFFLADLRKLGFVEGRNLLIEHRRVDPPVTKAKRRRVPRRLRRWASRTQRDDPLAGLNAVARRTCQPRRLQPSATFWQRRTNV